MVVTQILKPAEWLSISSFQLYAVKDHNLIHRQNLNTNKRVDKLLHCTSITLASGHSLQTFITFTIMRHVYTYQWSRVSFSQVCPPAFIWCSQGKFSLSAQLSNSLMYIYPEKCVNLEAILGEGCGGQETLFCTLMIAFFPIQPFSSEVLKYSHKLWCSFPMRQQNYAAFCSFIVALQQFDIIYWRKRSAKCARH